MNFYRDEKNNKDCIIDLVSEKMKCAVYIEKDKKWYRGVVLKVIDCKMTKVKKLIIREYIQHKK